MLDDVDRYLRYRFPPAISATPSGYYYRFTLSFRDVEDLLAQRGITVSHESIRHYRGSRLAPSPRTTARPRRQRTST